VPRITNPSLLLSRSHFWVWLVCALHGVTAGAATYVVTTLDDSGPGSLRQAIFDGNANGGGSVTFSNVTGTIIASTPLPPITGNMAIVGPGTNALTISRRLVFQSGTTNFLAALTIANAGPGILNAGSLTVSNCTLRPICRCAFTASG
jgi:hypothetical protein